jgi:glycosyltransferase involved in cell wall biosynthesis
MKILHCCLSCFYIDDYAYQENRLVQEHVKQGHDVLVLASTEVFSEDGRLDYTKPRSYLGSDGAQVIRLGYNKFLFSWASRKIRSYKGLQSEMDRFKPDLIIFHGMVGFALWTVARYVRRNSQVKMVADSHEDFHNSRKTLAAKILYSIFYVPMIKFSVAQIEKIYFITWETKEFCRSVYGLEDEKLEYLPLGGKVLSRETYDRVRSETRNRLRINQNELVILQSGKFDRKKRLLDSIESFLSLNLVEGKLILAGTIIDDEELIKDLISSSENVLYLGWVDSNDLKKLMVAADVYLQPGTQSASMQEAICSGCALVLHEYQSHVEMDVGNILFINEENSISTCLNALSENREGVDKMKNMSLDYAREHLDYSFLAEKILR